MNLVTVVQVNNALKLNLEGDLDYGSGDDGDNDRLDDIELKIAQASAIVLDYLKNPEGSEYWDAETPDSVPGTVSAATIMVVRALLDDTAESAAMLSGLAGADKVDLANPIVALLHRLRDPALA